MVVNNSICINKGKNRLRVDGTGDIFFYKLKVRYTRNFADAVKQNFEEKQNNAIYGLILRAHLNSTAVSKFLRIFRAISITFMSKYWTK